MPVGGRKSSKTVESITCAQCEISKGLSNYYTYGGDLKDITKYRKFPICKKCILDGFDKIYDSKLKKKYIYDYCVAMNKPFISSMYDRAINESIDKDNSNAIKEYFRLVGGASYNKKTFIDGDLSLTSGGFVGDVNRDVTEEESVRWDEYEFESNGVLFRHEDMFQNIKKHYGIQNTIENDDNLIALVVLKNRRSGLVQNGDVKEMKPIQDTIKQLEATLGITKMKDQVAGGTRTYGEFIKYLEENDPYMEKPSEFEDIDGFITSSEIILASTDVAFGKRDKEELRKTLLAKYEV